MLGKIKARNVSLLNDPNWLLIRAVEHCNSYEFLNNVSHATEFDLAKVCAVMHGDAEMYKLATECVVSLSSAIKRAGEEGRYGIVLTLRSSCE